MQKTNAFVLRRQDFREYDRIYTLYSQEYGKISLLARGARRIKSKLAPHLEGLNEVRLNFAKGKIFNHLSGANVVGLNKGLLKDGEKIAFVSDCFYLLDRFIKPEEEDIRIYNLMKEVFGAINGVIASPSEGVAISYNNGIASSMTPRNDTYSKLRVYFFWRLADLLGYRPQLDECALCGKISSKQQVVSSKVKFNITDNIIICGECVGDGIFIQENILNNLKIIFEIHVTDFLKIYLDNQLIAITEKARQIKLSEL